MGKTLGVVGGAGVGGGADNCEGESGCNEGASESGYVGGGVLGGALGGRGMDNGGEVGLGAEGCEMMGLLMDSGSFCPGGGNEDWLSLISPTCRICSSSGSFVSRDGKSRASNFSRHSSLAAASG